MDAMKTVILMRHAKSSWRDRSLDDHDRPLKKRGREAAPRMARWLEGEGLRPECVLCSSARRARETLELMREADPALPEPEMAPKLYEAAPAVLLGELKRLPEDCDSVLMIGHQPGLGELLRLIAGGVASARLKRAFEKFPTAAVAVLEADIAAWPELDPEAARLVAFTAPRELSGP